MGMMLSEGKDLAPVTIPVQEGLKIPLPIGIKGPCTCQHMSAYVSICQHMSAYEQLQCWWREPLWL